MHPCRCSGVLREVADCCATSCPCAVQRRRCICHSALSRFDVQPFDQWEGSDQSITPALLMMVAMRRRAGAEGCGRHREEDLRTTSSLYFEEHQDPSLAPSLMNDETTTEEPRFIAIISPPAHTKRTNIVAVS
jgi:hypothetical protein